MYGFIHSLKKDGKHVQDMENPIEIVWRDGYDGTLVVTYKGKKYTAVNNPWLGVMVDDIYGEVM
jgi:hypothetical protein